jgi:hypothetical protein
VAPDLAEERDEEDGAGEADPVVRVRRGFTLSPWGHRLIYNNFHPDCKGLQYGLQSFSSEMLFYRGNAICLFYFYFFRNPP